MWAPCKPKAGASPPTSAADAPARSGRTRSKRDPELDAAIGTRIRAARLASRMSQTELAATVGISFQQMQKYEGRRDRVAASTLQELAAAMGMHPGSFFDAEMTVPGGAVADVKAALRIAEVVERIRDPGVLRRLVALAEALAESKQTSDAPEA